MGDENWCAFALAILYHETLTPEEAFERLATIKPQPPPRLPRSAKSDQEIEEMLEMRIAGLSYREIGAIFGISKDAAFKRILRGRPKCPSACAILIADSIGGFDDGENEEETGG